MRWAAFLVMPMTLLLGGCSYAYDIVASIQGGKVTFRADADRPKLFAPNACVTWFRVSKYDEQSQTENVVWSFEPRNARQTGNACVAEYPITYGVVPSAAREPVPAQPLRAGVRYEIEARGPGIDGSGAFTLRQVLVLENLPAPVG